MTTPTSAGRLLRSLQANRGYLLRHELRRPPLFRSRSGASHADIRVRMRLVCSYDQADNPLFGVTDISEPLDRIIRSQLAFPSGILTREPTRMTTLNSLLGVERYLQCETQHHAWKSAFSLRDVG